MGLFDLFKKKKTDDTFPENELEKSLMKGATDAGARKEFYQKLLWNQLYLLTPGHSEEEEGTQVLEENATVQLVTFENGQIPVFTSTNRIFDKGVVKQQVPFISLKGKDLFGFTKGATFVVNPYSDYAKELTPAEIESIMNGTIYNQIDEVEKENEKVDAFNALFREAGKKQEGLIFLDGYRRKPLSDSDRKQLEASVEDFRKCLNIIPDHWQSMMLMAKAYQRLEQHEEALEILESAFNIETENHSIPMEASLEAMHLKNLDKALFYSDEAVKRSPDNFAVMGNHAMNLLIAEKDDEAKATIEKAMSLEPNDAVNQNIASIIRDVVSGKRKRPTFEDTIK